MSTRMIVDTTVKATGKRSVQMWVEDRRPVCVAGVYVDNGSAVEFTINSACPRDLIDDALEMYAAVRECRGVRATHTITWPHGSPVFTPIEASSDSLFELEVSA